MKSAPAFIRYKGKSFIRLFRQNSENGFFFSSTSEAEFYRNNNSDESFSILGMIDDIERHDQKYEFIIYYEE